VARHPAGPIVLLLCAAVAGCSVHPSASGGVSLATKAASAPASARTAPSTPATTSPAPPQQVPVLGQSRPNTQGYGSVRPRTLDNGGDPTGIVTNLSWTSWGGAQAVGTGTGYYDPPNVPVAGATPEQAAVVAFDLGTCDGQYMYQAIEWYFPESGGSFSAANYLDVCSWTYQGSG
jgi:hypothetical protein